MSIYSFCIYLLCILWKLQLQHFRARIQHNIACIHCKITVKFCAHNQSKCVLHIIGKSNHLHVNIQTDLSFFYELVLSPILFIQFCLLSFICFYTYIHSWQSYSSSYTLPYWFFFPLLAENCNTVAITYKKMIAFNECDLCYVIVNITWIIHIKVIPEQDCSVIELRRV